MQTTRGRTGGTAPCAPQKFGLAVAEAYLTLPAKRAGADATFSRGEPRRPTFPLLCAKQPKLCCLPTWPCSAASGLEARDAPGPRQTMALTFTPAPGPAPACARPPPRTPASSYLPQSASTAPKTSWETHGEGDCSPTPRVPTASVPLHPRESQPRRLWLPTHR